MYKRKKKIQPKRKGDVQTDGQRERERDTRERERERERERDMCVCVCVRGVCVRVC